MTITATPRPLIAKRIALLFTFLLTLSGPPKSSANGQTDEKGGASSDTDAVLDNFSLGAVEFTDSTKPHSWNRPPNVRYVVLQGCGGGGAGGNGSGQGGEGSAVETQLIGPLTAATYTVTLGKGGFNLPDLVQHPTGTPSEDTTFVGEGTAVTFLGGYPGGSGTYVSPNGGGLGQGGYVFTEGMRSRGARGGSPGKQNVASGLPGMASVFAAGGQSKGRGVQGGGGGAGIGPGGNGGSEDGPPTGGGTCAGGGGADGGPGGPGGAGYLRIVPLADVEVLIKQELQLLKRVGELQNALDERLKSLEDIPKSLKPLTPPKTKSQSQ